MYQSDVLGRSADLHPGLQSKTRLLSERKTKYCTKSYWIKEIFIIIWRKLRKRQDNKSSQLFTVEYTCNSWYGRQFQNAEFENVSAPPTVPSHFLRHWKPVQVKLRSPICTLDRNGSGWNFKIKRLKDEKKSPAYKISQLQNSEPNKTHKLCCKSNHFRTICLTQVHVTHALLSSWRVKILELNRMYALLSEMDTRLLSYYQKKFLISFTFKHRKIKQHMPELHKPKHLAGNKIILKDRSSNIL